VRGWLSATINHKRKNLHPLYQLLLIGFLCGSVNLFLKAKKSNPFGDGPWKCYNKFCGNYNHEVIYHVQLESEKRASGIFSCEYCGFTYLRSKGDCGRYSRVIRYGELFKRKLEAEFCEMKSFHNVFKTSGLWHDTAQRLYQIYLETGNCDLIDDENMDNRYRRNKLIEYLQDNPSATRNMIRKNLYKDYVWLQKYDRNWVLQVIPKRITYKPPGNKGLLVNWEKRDEKLLQELILRNEEFLKLHGESLTPQTIVRIIGRANYEVNLHKLPNTHNFIKTLLEVSYCSSQPSQYTF
jgi:hypothetical protein